MAEPGSCASVWTGCPLAGALWFFPSRSVLLQQATLASFPRQCQAAGKDRLRSSGTFHVSASIPFAIVPLPKARHIAKPRVKCGQIGGWSCNHLPLRVQGIERKWGDQRVESKEECGTGKTRGGWEPGHARPPIAQRVGSLP